MLLPTPESYPWDRGSVRMRGRGMSASQLQTRRFAAVRARGRVPGSERGWASVRNRAAPCRSRTRRRTRYPNRMFGSGFGARPGARGRKAFPQDREERASQDDDSQPSRLLPDFVPRGNAGPGLDLFFCAEVCTQNLTATGLLPRVVLPAELHDGVPAGPGVCARR